MCTLHRGAARSPPHKSLFRTKLSPCARGAERCVSIIVEFRLYLSCKPSLVTDWCRPPRVPRRPPACRSLPAVPRSIRRLRVHPQCVRQCSTLVSEHGGKSAGPPVAGCGCRGMWQVGGCGVPNRAGGLVSWWLAHESSTRRQQRALTSSSCTPPTGRLLLNTHHRRDTIVSAESADRFRRKGWPFAPGHTTRCWYAPPWQRRSLRPSRVGARA